MKKIFFFILLSFSLSSFAGPLVWSLAISRGTDYSTQIKNYVNGESASGQAAFFSQDLINRSNMIGARNPVSFCQLHNFDVMPYTCESIDSERIRLTIQHSIKYTIKNNYILQLQAKKRDGAKDTFDNIRVNNIPLNNNYQLVWGPKNGTDNGGIGYTDIIENIDISVEFYIKGQNFKTDIENMIEFYTEVVPL